MDPVNGHLLLCGMTSSPRLSVPPIAGGAADAPGLGADLRGDPAGTLTAETWHGHGDRSALIESAEADEPADNGSARVVLLQHAAVTRQRV